eukprot:3946646-Amphidinium_carterae.4
MERQAPNGMRLNAAPQGEEPPLRMQMLHAAQREMAQRTRRQEIRRHGQPYNGRVRARGPAANLHVNIFDNQAVVNVEGGDRFDPPDFGPVRFDDLMRTSLADINRPLVRLNPQRIPVPDDDGDEDGDGFGMIESI